MQFLQPVYLWLLTLAVIPIALYLFRRKAKSVNVSTLVFFKTLAREHQESAWLRKLKKLVSFLLTMMVLLAAVFSLARVILGTAGDGGFRTYVILLDRSASMAVEEDGVSRLEEARRRIRDRFQSIPEEAGVALIAYDSRPEIIQPRTLVRRELLSRLDEVAIRPVAGNSAAALESAIMLAAPETPALVLHAGDFGESGESGFALPEEISIERIDVAADQPVNAGITSFQIRKTPLERDSFDVHAQLSLNRAAPGKRVIQLELFVGGVPSQVRELDLEPGERETFEFRVRGAGGQLLRMQLQSEDDAFPLDDTVIAPLPDPRPIVVVWIRENSEDEPEDAYTNLALRAIQETGTLELLAGTPAQWPLQHEVDAVIFDGWLPPEWPRDMPAVIINPPGQSGPILAQALESPIPYDSVRVGNEDHPVLFRVSSSRIAVTQTAVFQPSGSFEPLWLAGNEPILAAGEVEGQRLVVMAFSPRLSERLPLTASFPLLLGNAVLWAVEGSDEARLRVRHLETGEFAEVSGGTLTWTQWSGERLRRRVLPLDSDTVEMDRTGIWQTDTGESGTAHLLSASETDVPAFRNGNGGEDGTPENGRSGSILGGGLVRVFLALIVLVLILESWLFHRFAVY